MKIKPLAILVILSAAAPAILAAPPAGGGTGIQFLPTTRMAPVGPAEGDEAFKKRRAAEKFGGFASRDAVAKGWDLMDHSEFIAFGNDSTLLPKGSVVHVPGKLLSHRVEKPTGRLIPWADFIANYRGLVTYLDVTLEQASGQVPVSAGTLEAAKKSGLIVVAVLNRNPISVHPGSLVAKAPPVE